MSKINRKSWVAVSAAALVAGAACTVTLVSHGVARADDSMSASSSDMSTMVKEQADKGKMMAADPSQMMMMKDEMAKMMVMDKMSMKIAMDPTCKQTLMEAAKDPNMMKVHEAAKADATDPTKMKAIMDQVMADPMAMKMVMHHAAMMAMMQDKAGGMGGMMDKGKAMMGDKMNDMK